MWQFSEAIDGLTVACNELGTPITGGNVSFYNETLGKSIYPTPVIGILGILEDASRVLKIAFRERATLILLLDGERRKRDVRIAGRRSGARNFLPPSIPRHRAGIVSGEPPQRSTSPPKNACIDCLWLSPRESPVQSAHDICDGGIAVTLAESCFAANRAQRSVSSGRIRTSRGTRTLQRARRSRCRIRSPTMLARVLETARQYGVGARSKSAK